MEYNTDFWNALDSLVKQSEVIIEEEKGRMCHTHNNSSSMKGILILRL